MYYENTPTVITKNLVRKRCDKLYINLCSMQLRRLYFTNRILPNLIYYRAELGTVSFNCRIFFTGINFRNKVELLMLDCFSKMNLFKVVDFLMNKFWTIRSTYCCCYEITADSRTSLIFNLLLFLELIFYPRSRCICKLKVLFIIFYCWNFFLFIRLVIWEIKTATYDDDMVIHKKKWKWNNNASTEFNIPQQNRIYGNIYVATENIDKFWFSFKKNISHRHNFFLQYFIKNIKQNWNNSLLNPNTSICNNSWM